MSSKPKRSAWAALRPRRTLAFRLSAAYSLAGLALVILATASLYIVLRTELDRSTELFLADKLHVLRTMLAERPDDEDALREEIELESAARRYQQFYIRLLDEHGAPIMTTPGMAEQLDLAELASRTRGRFERSIAMAGRQGQPFRVASATVAVGTPPTHSDTVQIAIDVSQEEELLARYRLWFWGILLATSVIFPLVGYRIARHGIRPVEEIAATARRITSTNLRERIGPEGYPSELASLAGTFNEMLDRLEESFDRISRFSADIAHDLRTPVNNIRGEAEVALARARTVDEYRDVLESSLEEAVRLSELIGDLLFLARAESPLTELHREQREHRRVADHGSRLLRSFRGQRRNIACRERLGRAAQRGTGSLTDAAGGEQPGLERHCAYAAGRNRDAGGRERGRRDSHRGLRHRRRHSRRSAAQSIRSLLPRRSIALQDIGRHRAGPGYRAEHPDASRRQRGDHQSARPRNSRHATHAGPRNAITKTAILRRACGARKNSSRVCGPASENTISIA